MEDGKDEVQGAAALDVGGQLETVEEEDSKVSVELARETRRAFDMIAQNEQHIQAIWQTIQQHKVDIKRGEIEKQETVARQDTLGELFESFKQQIARHMDEKIDRLVSRVKARDETFNTFLSEEKEQLREEREHMTSRMWKLEKNSRMKETSYNL